MILDILPLERIPVNEIIEQKETENNTQDETPSFQILPEEKPEEISWTIKIIWETKWWKVLEKYNATVEKEETLQFSSCCTFSHQAPTILLNAFYMFLAALIIFTIIEYFELRSKKAEHPFKTALFEAFIACIIVFLFCAIVACCFMYFARLTL